MNWQTINSIAEAVEFLEERCDLLAIQMEIVPPLWKVVSLDGEFDALFSDIQLLDFAREERDIRFRLARELATDSIAELTPLEELSAGGAA